MKKIEKELEWNKEAKLKFDRMIGRIPLFHREIAKTVVRKKAALSAQQRDCQWVEESDIVQAFFSEVPKAFYSLMIRLLDEVGFDYKKYGPSQKELASTKG